MYCVHFSTKITDVFLKIPTYRYFLFVLALYSFQNVNSVTTTLGRKSGIIMHKERQMTSRIFYFFFISYPIFLNASTKSSYLALRAS